MPRLSDLVRGQGQPQEDAASSAGPALTRTEGAATPAAPTPDATDWIRLAQDELARFAQGLHQGTVPSFGDLAIIAQGIVTALQEDDRLLAQVMPAGTGAPTEHTLPTGGGASGKAATQLIMNPINVSILAIKMGITLEYDRQQLEQLALAGLLHDVGMFFVPEEILVKRTPLTTAERDVIEQHPHRGGQVIQGLGPDYGWLVEVVTQEHERAGGQGYPNQLRESDIHPFAQIIGVADVLDALVSPRPYHRLYLPHDAVREILIAEKAAFSREVLKTLMEGISLYPLGTHVRLNTGEVGVVTQLKPRYPLRPVIRTPAEAHEGAQVRTLDLSTSTQMRIVEVVKSVGAQEEAGYG